MQTADEELSKMLFKNAVSTSLYSHNKKRRLPNKGYSFKTIILRQKLSFFKERLNTQLKSVISAEERVILLAKQKLLCDLPNIDCVAW